MSVSKGYRFLRCQVHRDFEDVQGWFLEVTGDDHQILKAIQEGVLANYQHALGEKSAIPHSSKREYHTKVFCRMCRTKCPRPPPGAYRPVAMVAAGFLLRRASQRSRRSFVGQTLDFGRLPQAWSQQHQIGA